MDRGGLRLTRPGWTPLSLLLLLSAVSVDVRPVLDRDDVNPMVVGVNAVNDAVDATTARSSRGSAAARLDRPPGDRN